MKRLCRVAAIALILLATSASLATAASKSLSGTYETTVKTAGSLNGTYHITFTPGHFALEAPYGITGHGTYSISGSKITVYGPSSSCKSAGVYEYKLSGSSLTFRKIKDSCPRAAILDAHAMKKV
jgi:hypothetical protein